MDLQNAVDTASLCLVHSRFAKVAAVRPKKKMELGTDDTFLKQYPMLENRAFYRSLDRNMAIEVPLHICDEDTFQRDCVAWSWSQW